MTTAPLVIWAIYGTGFPTSLSVRGVSAEADKIRDMFDALLRDRLESITLGEAYREAIEALDDVFQEASSENWDGYGAKMVNAITYGHARKFLEALPTALPAPEVAAEPDGEIAFEWYIAPRWVFSVSVGPEDALTYAGMFGRSKSHGTEEYYVDELPKTIMENISRLFSKEAKQRNSR